MNRKALAALSCFAFAATPAFAEIKLEGYGFIKASYIGTTDEFNVDAKPVFVKSTNGITGNAKDGMESGRGQFMIKHSRFGVNATSGEKLSMKLEFDLDGNNDNNVGVTSSDLGIFRARQANFSYKLSENGTLTVGKKWEIFSPVGPHSYQYTTIQFWAGNTGFITDGADYVHKIGNASIAAEIKNLGSTGSGIGSDVMELSGPAMTLRADYRVAGQYFGAAVLYSNAKFEDAIAATAGDKDAKIHGYNVFYNGKFGSTDVVAEYYYGQNLGSAVTGALSLAKPNGRKNKDQGYYVSVKHQFEALGVYGGYGKAELKDEANSAGNSFGNLASNEFMRLGVDYAVDKNFTVYFEGSRVNSGFYEGASVKKYDGIFYDLGVVAKF